MTLSRLVAPRLDDPASEVGDEPSVAVDPPMLAAIRCVYGVGVEPGAVPDGDGLRPVYCVALPVDAPGSLDADDTHEFDAASLLAALQARASARAWAMRLELELVQTASAAACVDLYLADAPSELHLRHTALQPGGGRRLTFGTGLVHTPAAVTRLAGTYRLVQKTGDGMAAGECSVQLGLTEYEFE